MTDEELKALTMRSMIEEQAKKSIQDINNVADGCLNYTPLLKYLRK